MEAEDDSKENSFFKYQVGYVPGVFDLFHVGHLNLLRNSKERCNHLIAGVLTDELVMHFKGKVPFIPFEERIAIVKAIKYVDEVVPVDFANTVKLEAWKLYHYDCHFSGNDHGADWNEDLRQLREVGSNMEFFQYTQSTSSTQIKKLIERAIL
jgi:cytidyltransferase-like protein